jgi:hypothetical protein
MSRRADNGSMHRNPGPHMLVGGRVLLGHWFMLWGRITGGWAPATSEAGMIGA